MKIEANPTTQSRFNPQEVQELREQPTGFGGASPRLGADVVILTDDPALSVLSNVFITGSVEEAAKVVAALSPEERTHGIMLCFNLDDLAGEVALLLERRGIPFRAGGGARPCADYWRTNRTARDVLNELWEARAIDFRTIYEWQDHENLIQVLEQTRNIEGSHVEVGVAWGSSAVLALKYMKAAGISRRCFFLDTFEGFDYAGAGSSVDANWTGGCQHWGTEANARDRLLPLSSPETGLDVEVLRANIMQDDLAEHIGQIASANLDVDMLDAVRHGLAKLAPRMAPGGILIVEDAGHTPLLYGARAAVAEFTATPLGSKFTSLYFPSGQQVLIRR